MDRLSIQLRITIMDILHQSKIGGHIGPAFSLCEIARASMLESEDPIKIFDQHKRRVVLSKGHGCLALYAALLLAGEIPAHQKSQFCAIGTHLGGHPERDVNVGIHATSGSLGHGLPFAVGMALSDTIQRLERDVVVIVGDGELNEGSNWEAALHAAKHKLGKLKVMIDLNGHQCNGPIEMVLPVPGLAEAWKALGWNVQYVDGHDVKAMEQLLFSADEGKPHLFLCKTTKGKGMGELEDAPACHYTPELTPFLLELRHSLEGLIQ